MSKISQYNSSMRCIAACFDEVTICQVHERVSELPRQMCEITCTNIEQNYCVIYEKL